MHKVAIFQGPTCESNLCLRSITVPFVFPKDSVISLLEMNVIEILSTPAKAIDPLDSA